MASPTARSLPGYRKAQSWSPKPGRLRPRAASRSTRCRRTTCNGAAGWIRPWAGRTGWSCPQGEGLASQCFPTTDWHLSVRGPNAGLSVLSHQGELPPIPAKRRFFTLTVYHPVYLRAKERNRTAAYWRERRRRHTVVEGIFASWDRLGWEKSRLRGLWKVDCEGYMAALAHNVKKLVRRMGRGIGTPDPASPDAGIIAGYESIMIDGAMGPTAPVRHSSSMSWLVIYLRPLLR